MSTDDSWRALVAEAARDKKSVDTLLRLHVRLPDGHCAGCTQRGRPVWPCKLHSLAVAARRLNDAG